MTEPTREKNLRHYTERRDSGRCLRCGRPRATGHAYCNGCLNYKRQWKAARRVKIEKERAELAEWKAVGLVLEPCLKPVS